MFIPNDNGYPTMVYNKKLGILGYAIVNNAKDHEALMKVLDPQEPKTTKKQKYTIEG